MKFFSSQVAVRNVLSLVLSGLLMAALSGCRSETAPTTKPSSNEETKPSDLDLDDEFLDLLEDDDNDYDLSAAAQTSGTQAAGKKANTQVPPPVTFITGANQVDGAGFLNFGNTCYMNSSFKALFSIPEFATYLDAARPILPNKYFPGTDDEHETANREVRGHLMDIFTDYSDRKAVGGHLIDFHKSLADLVLKINPKSTVGKDLQGLEQVDAEEFTNKVLDTIDYPAQIFERRGGRFSLNSTVTHGLLGKEFVPVNMLSVSIDGKSIKSVQDAIQKHSSLETLTEDNALKNDAGKKYDQSDVATILFHEKTKPVSHIILQLKRFDATGKKISKSIEVNDKISFVTQEQDNGKLTAKTRAILKNLAKPDQLARGAIRHEMILSGLVLHWGSVGGGHYTALTREYNDKGKLHWYFHDDASVYELKLDAKTIGQLKTKIQTQAYILVYREMTNEDKAWEAKKAKHAADAAAQKAAADAAAALDPAKTGTTGATGDAAGDLKDASVTSGTTAPTVDPTTTSTAGDATTGAKSASAPTTGVAAKQDADAAAIAGFVKSIADDFAALNLAKSGTPDAPANTTTPPAPDASVSGVTANSGATTN